MVWLVSVRGASSGASTQMTLKVQINSDCVSGVCESELRRRLNEMHHVYVSLSAERTVRLMSHLYTVVTLLFALIEVRWHGTRVNRCCA
jgi:hypothetical protein